MNTLKQRILVMAALSGGVLCVGTRARAQERLTIQEMRFTTGKTKMASQCNSTAGTGCTNSYTRTAGTCRRDTGFTYGICLDKAGDPANNPAPVCNYQVNTCHHEQWTPSTATDGGVLADCDKKKASYADSYDNTAGCSGAQNVGTGIPEG